MQGLQLSGVRGSEEQGASVHAEIVQGLPAKLRLFADDRQLLLEAGVTPEQIWNLSEGVWILRDSSGQAQLLSCTSAAAASEFSRLVEPHLEQHQAAQQQQAERLQRAEAAQQAVKQDVFSRKTEETSATDYFRYYAGLANQANMLQDYVRTGTYYAAILENAADFEGKVVMDVGAGSGILSLFAAQAGAAKVYAVEASGMAQFAKQLAAANPGIGNRVEVIHSRLEELDLPAKVDVLVSEPMGTLLVNERMLETYLYARDHFLKPGGRMFPVSTEQGQSGTWDIVKTAMGKLFAYAVRQEQLGRIHVAAFSDEVLHWEVANKAIFWTQPVFYGVDVTCLHMQAKHSHFEEVVIDAIPPAVLVSDCSSKTFDFGTIPDEDLLDIKLPLQLQVDQTCPVHGIACWFDVLFEGSTQQRWLSTAPGQPTTHWFQLRCLLEEPLYMQRGSTVTGELHLKAHNRQSYDLCLTLTAPSEQPNGEPQKASGKYDLKNPFYRQLTQSYMPTQAYASDMQSTGLPEADAGAGYESQDPTQQAWLYQQAQTQQQVQQASPAHQWPGEPV